jgi:hypothetical protein
VVAIVSNHSTGSIESIVSRRLSGVNKEKSVGSHNDRMQKKPIWSREILKNKKYIPERLSSP